MQKNILIKQNNKFWLAAFLEIDPGKSPAFGVLNELFFYGLDLLYLRTNSIKEVPWGKILNNINPQFLARIIFPVQAKEAFPGLNLIGHWKEADRKKMSPELDLQGNNYSTSVHHLPDILDLPPAFGYVFYSPIFESISKPGYQPQHSLEEIQQTLQSLRQAKPELPLIMGLGGITAANVKLVQELGLNGAALMGALWQASDPVQAFKEIKKALEF